MTPLQARSLTQRLRDKIVEVLRQGTPFKVWIAHNLLGDHLDSDELIASVGMMAVVADHLDDELKARFGGQRWREAQR